MKKVQTDFNPHTNHNPKHKYDCGNCKFNWCCGYLCACNLKESPEPPEWLQRQLKAIQKLLNSHLSTK